MPKQKQEMLTLHLQQSNKTKYIQEYAVMQPYSQNTLVQKHSALRTSKSKKHRKCKHKPFRKTPYAPGF